MTKTNISVNNATESELEDFALKETLQDYTELVVVLFDGAYEKLIEDGAVYQRVLLSAGLGNYGFIAAIILIACATKDGKLNITEMLQIDCSTPKSSGSAIYLLKQVMLTCFEKE